MRLSQVEHRSTCAVRGSRGGKPPCASGTYTTQEAGTRSLYVPYGVPPGRTCPLTGAPYRTRPRPACPSQRSRRCPGPLAAGGSRRRCRGSATAHPRHSTALDLPWLSSCRRSRHLRRHPPPPRPVRNSPLVSEATRTVGAVVARRRAAACRSRGSPSAALDWMTRYTRPARRLPRRLLLAPARQCMRYLRV